MAHKPGHTPLQSPDQKTAILVLGMHRSGTSALTGLLELFGATTPKGQIPASTQNAKGFFEAKKVARLNDDLLSRTNLAWHNWTTADAPELTKEAQDAFVKRAVTVLKDEFGPAPLIALKDPRICRLVPFWREVLRKSGHRPLAILALRNPMEVAQSLATRNGFALEHGLLLWMTYVLDSEFTSRGLPRAVTTFDQLLNNPQQAIKTLHAALSLKTPRASAERKAAIDAFVSPDLRHHVDAPLDTLPPLFAEVYHLLSRWARNGENTADRVRLDHIRTAFRDICAPHAMAAPFYETLYHLTPAPSDSPAGDADALRRANTALVNTQEQMQHSLRHAEETCEEQALQIDRLTAETTRRDDELGRLSQLFLNEKTQNQQLAQDLKSLEQQASDLRTDIQTLSTQRRLDLKERDKTSAENTELHGLVARVETERARLQGENTELHALVARVETERARLQGENTELHALVARVETERARLQGENTELHALVAKVEQARHALISSSSWRYTRPIRLIGRLLRR